MSQIYKLNHIQGDEIKHIDIFTINSSSSISDNYQDDNGNPIFTMEE